MEFSLSQIISSVGTSVQIARYALEESAVELYFKGGYEQVDNDKLLPMTKTISLPKELSRGADGKTIVVPVTALFSHNTMTLKNVDVSMHLRPYEQGGEIVYSLCPDNSKDDPKNKEYAELSLSFALNDPPEGMARLNQESIKLL